jgi:hypothetical protein
MNTSLTISDLERMACLTITPAIAASVLNQDPHSIRLQAHCDPKMLGYPVIVTGRRVKIPRIPFIQFIKGGTP